MTATRLNPTYYNTRVKGNSESIYRTGDVNLTAANIGAADRKVSVYISGTNYVALLIQADGNFFGDVPGFVLEFNPTGIAFRYRPKMSTTTGQVTIWSK